MKRNNIIRFIVMIMLVLILVSNVSGSSYPGKWEWDNYWSTVEGMFGINSNTWQYNEPPAMNWYPLENWEIKTCSSDFTSEYFYEDNRGANTLTVDKKVYTMTFVLNGEVQETQYTDVDGNPEYLLSLGWYIQGIPQGSSTDNLIKYKIKLEPGNKLVPLNSDGHTELEFTAITGTSGFYANYTTEQYEKAIIIIDSQNYEFDLQGISLNGGDENLEDLYTV